MMSVWWTPLEKVNGGKFSRVVTINIPCVDSIKVGVQSNWGMSTIRLGVWVNQILVSQTRELFPTSDKREIFPACYHREFFPSHTMVENSADVNVLSQIGDGRKSGSRKRLT